MGFALVFAFGAICLATLAIQAGGPAWILLWPAANLVALSWIYGADRRRALGKRDDGTISSVHVLLLLPYYLLTWGVWHLYRRISSEPTSHEVAPGVWVGRRPFPEDLPAGVALIVDLTAEFPVAGGVAARATVIWLPALDARGPDPAALRAVVARVLSTEGPVYIHCAAGHGRSAAAAAAVLIARGDAPDIDGAEALMKKARPRIHLHSAQRASVEGALG